MNVTTEKTTFDLGVKPPTMRCTVCGVAQPVVLPMKLSEVTYTLDKFNQKHAKCEKRSN